MINETSRLTSKKIELNEEQIEILNRKLQKIKNSLDLKEEVEVNLTFFLKDNKKEGGRYNKIIGIIKKIDDFEKIIVLEDKTIIPIEDILQIDSENLDLDL